MPRRARLDDSHDLEVEALGDLRLHIALVITAINPRRARGGLGVHVAFVHDLERERQRLVLRELDVGVGNVKILGGKGVHEQIVELVGVEDAQRVERVVADAAVLVEHQHALVVVGRPGTGRRCRIAPREASGHRAFPGTSSPSPSWSRNMPAELMSLDMIEDKAPGLSCLMPAEVSAL